MVVKILPTQSTSQKWRVIHDLRMSDWLASNNAPRSTHAAACVGTPSFLSWVTCPFMYTPCLSAPASTCWVLWTLVLQGLFSAFKGVYSDVELLGHDYSIFFIIFVFEEMPLSFPQQLHNFTFLPTMQKEFQITTSSPAFVIFWVFFF